MIDRSIDREREREVKREMARKREVNIRAVKVIDTFIGEKTMNVDKVPLKVKGKSLTR